jgi:hypothetical protein
LASVTVIVSVTAVPTGWTPSDGLVSMSTFTIPTMTSGERLSPAAGEKASFASAFA